MSVWVSICFTFYLFPPRLLLFILGPDSPHTPHPTWSCGYPPLLALIGMPVCLSHQLFFFLLYFAFVDLSMRLVIVIYFFSVPAPNISCGMSSYIPFILSLLYGPHLVCVCVWSEAVIGDDGWMSFFFFNISVRACFHCLLLLLFSRPTLPITPTPTYNCSPSYRSTTNFYYTALFYLLCYQYLYLYLYLLYLTYLHTLWFFFRVCVLHFTLLLNKLSFVISFSRRGGGRRREGREGREREVVGKCGIESSSFRGDLRG